MAAQLSSIGISHHNLLPHFPSIRLSTFNAALTLGLLHKPYTTAPNRCTFQATCGPVWGMYGCSKGCLSLIPFRLPQISCFTLSLKCFSSDSDNCPDVGIRPPASVPPPAEGRSIPTNAPVFRPLSFYILPSFAWFYIFFFTGQVLLSALSWCSACTSVSEGVFLMYPWREMYSMSIYSSAILFSPHLSSIKSKPFLCCFIVPISYYSPTK